ncbi:MAG: penicillin acylase family protein, partial [Flavobacteriales bacterium]|nr:penicillin acylase family protein [Flavobacteriales bacterium]
MKLHLKCLVLGLLLLCQFNTKGQINVSNIDIVRDSWGVPHIFGKTDAEVAYGLAWATCEDDFETVQKLLLAVRGRLGEVIGKNGALLDFMGKIAQVEDVVEAQFETALSAEYKKYLSGYVQGLNKYAETHVDEVLRKNFFPITEKDIIKSYTITLVFLTNVHVEMQQIFSRSIVLYERTMKYKGNLPEGSNAFAFNKNKTANGHTYLAVNSHQPLEGLFSWYEAHLVSEEGLNILGGTFPGGCSIFHGVNEYLGWAATLNHPDLCDVYKLEMHPKEKLKYKFDDGYETLTPVIASTKVRVAGIRIPIRRKFYQSKYGITIKNADGFYSLRFPANMDIGAAEQLWHLNKAKNLEEFNEILNQGHLAGTNNIYADGKGNIQFISLGKFGYRDPTYDWLSVLPGNTSKTLWEPKFHPVTELAQYRNPKAGYLFNTNATPFFATDPNENLRSKDFNHTFGYQNEEKINNRTIRAHELISSYNKITWEDFKTIKYDQAFNCDMKTYNIDNMHVFKNLNPAKYPKLKEAIQVINDWDHTADVEDTEAALLVVSLGHLMKEVMANGQQYATNVFPEEEYVKALKAGSRHLKKHFGSLRVRLGHLQKHVRGDKVIGVGGAPAVLAANISKPYKKGML